MHRTYAITTKGQVTIPKELRDAVGLRSGGQASISLLDSRTIIIKAPLSVNAIRQAVGKPSSMQPLTAKEKLKLEHRGLRA